MKSLLVLMLIGALTGGNDQRLFESGMAFKVNQNYEQALREFNLLVQQYPESDFADNALLEIGRYHLQVGETDQALAVFQQVVNAYGRSDSADNAHLYIGRVQFQRGELDAAYTTFFHIKGAFPQSDVLDESFYNLARISSLRGHHEKALYFLSLIYTRFSESDIFDDALLQAAYCYYQIGKAEEALKMTGVITEGPRMPAAQNMTRDLLRFFLNRKYRVAKPYFQMDSPALLEAAPGDMLYVSADRESFIQLVSPGKNRRQNTAGEVQALYDSPVNGLYFSTGDQLFLLQDRTPLRFVADGEPLTEITSFFVDHFGRYWLYDKDNNVVYRYNKDRSLDRKFVMGKVDFIKLRRDGNIFVVGDSRDLIEVRDMDGMVKKRMNQYPDVVDLGFDGLGNVYLLADRGRNLVVLRHDLSLFQTLVLESVTGSSTRYDHLAVDDAGNVYISSTRNNQIVRIY